MRVRLLLLCSALFSFPARAADQSTATRLSELRGVWEAHFNHDASRVVTQMRGGAVELWDVAKGTRIAGDLEIPSASESHVMSADGKRVLVHFKDGARVFDASTGVAVSPYLNVRFREQSEARATFSPDDETLVVFKAAEASILRVRSGEKIAGIPLPVRSDDDSGDNPASAAFTADGVHCFLHDGRGTVRRFDGKNWKAAGAPIRHPAAELAYNFAFDISEDGKWLATSDSPGENGPKGGLQVWDAITSKPLGAPLITTNGFVASFLHGTDRIAITPARGDGQVYDLPSMKISYAIRARDDLDGPHVKVSPDGKWILSWGPDRVLHAIDAASGKLAGNTSNSAKVANILFAPDSSAAYVIYDNTAFFLEGHHDNYLMKMTLPELKITGSIRVLEFVSKTVLSPDGRRLLILQGPTDRERIAIFDTATMKPLGPAAAAK